MTSTVAEQALQNALGNQSWSNYPAIIQGFTAKGLAPEDIEPRVNVFTYHAWRALGRQVRKGEHGVKIVTFVPMSKREIGEDGSERVAEFRRPRTTTVFHVSQTDPIN